MLFPCPPSGLFFIVSYCWIVKNLLKIHSYSSWHDLLGEKSQKSGNTEIPQFFCWLSLYLNGLRFKETTQLIGYTAILQGVACGHQVSFHSQRNYENTERFCCESHLSTCFRAQICALLVGIVAPAWSLVVCQFNFHIFSGFCGGNLKTSQLLELV